jgi:hypothetical protein
MFKFLFITNALNMLQIILYKYITCIIYSTYYSLNFIMSSKNVIINSSYAREEKLDKIVAIDDYNSINKKLSGCTRL